MAAIIKDVTNGVVNGNLWTVPVMINRSNKLPLDKYSLFTTLEAAQAYATNPASMAYVGQVLTVAKLDDTNKTVTDVTVYVIDKDSTLKEVGKETFYRIQAVDDKKNSYKLQSSIDNSNWNDVEGSNFSFDYTDMVVSGGSLVDVILNSDGQYVEEKTDIVVSTATEPGKYLKLTIKNSDNIIYINVKDLTDVYTADNTTLQLNGGQFSAKEITLDSKGDIVESSKSALVTGTLLENYVNYRVNWEVIDQ